MIKIGPLGNSGGGGLIDATAIHTDRSYEIMSLVEIPLLMGNEVIVLEDPLNGYAKRKVTIGSFSGVDINAFHKTISGEFDALVEKFPAASEDLFVIEDSNDLYSKKKIQLQAITLDNIGEGTTYKKFLSTERTKLTGIEDNADVTDVDNVTTAEESINVNAHSDITSAGADIEDAVSKRHTQGTDTTLGIQAQNSDWGTYRITNAGEPVDPGDYATKNYVDTQELSHDPNAVHLNAGSEITTLTEKVSPVATDIIIIEDSEDSFSKKKVVFPIYSNHDPNAVHLNAGSEITTLTEKISPVVDDILIIEDSEDSFAKKKVAFPVYSDHDPNAIHLNADSEITTLDEKITPVATDILIIEDSEDSFSKKKVSFPLQDVNVFHKNVSGEIEALVSKPVLSSSDIILIEDSSAGWEKKKAVLPTIFSDNTAKGLNSYNNKISLDDWESSDITNYFSFGSNKIKRTLFIDKKIIQIGFIKPDVTPYLIVGQSYSEDIGYTWISDSSEEVSPEGFLRTSQSKDGLIYIIKKTPDSVTTKTVHLYDTTSLIKESLPVLYNNQNVTSIICLDNDTVLVGAGTSTSPLEPKAQIIKRNNSGIWSIVYSGQDGTKICDFCELTAEGTIYAYRYIISSDRTDILKSINNGDSWIVFPKPPIGGEVIKMIYGGNNVFIGIKSYSGGYFIIRNIDGGNTYTDYVIVDMLEQLTDIFFIGEGTVVVTSMKNMEAFYYISYDTGKTWKRSKVSTESNNLDDFQASFDPINKKIFFSPVQALSPDLTTSNLYNKRLFICPIGYKDVMLPYQGNTVKIPPAYNDTPFTISSFVGVDVKDSIETENIVITIPDDFLYIGDGNLWFYFINAGEPPNVDRTFSVRATMHNGPYTRTDLNTKFSSFYIQFRDYLRYTVMPQSFISFLPDTSLRSSQQIGFSIGGDGNQDNNHPYFIGARMKYIPKK